MTEAAPDPDARAGPPVRKFLVIADDSPEFPAALRYACARARATDGRITLLRVLEPAVFEHWSGVREEMERQQRSEAEALLQKLAAQVVEATGQPPEFLVKESGDVRGAIRAVIVEDPEIKILVLAAAVHGRGPVTAWSGSNLARSRVSHHGRKAASDTSCQATVPGDAAESLSSTLGGGTGPRSGQGRGLEGRDFRPPTPARFT